jgi:hypothetical protein
MTPLSDAEWAEYCLLLVKPRTGTALTAAESTRCDDLAKRGKIPRPGTPPPTITIPVMRPWDTICQNEGGQAPIA